MFIIFIIIIILFLLLLLFVIIVIFIKSTHLGTHVKMVTFMQALAGFIIMTNSVPRQETHQQ